MVMLLSSSSLAYANDEAALNEIDIEFLEFLGDISGLESLGVDLDGLLGIDPNSGATQSGGSDEN